MQIDQKVARRINFDKGVQVLAEVNGAPASFLYSDEEMAANDLKEQNAQQMANLVNAAQPISQSIKNIAQANQAAQTPAF